MAAVLALLTQLVYQATSARIVAIDILEDFLTKARQRTPNVSFNIADAINLPYSPDTFDVVYGSSILHHLNLDSALKEIYRVLKPKGRLVFAESNMLNPQIFFQKNIPWLKRLMGDSPDETAFVRQTLARRLIESGFSNTRIIPHDFLHPYTPAALISPIKNLGQIVREYLSSKKLPVL